MYEMCSSLISTRDAFFTLVQFGRYKYNLGCTENEKQLFKLGKNNGCTPLSLSGSISNYISRGTIPEVT